VVEDRETGPLRPPRPPPPFWKRGYDRVLLKEVIHHLDPSDRVGIFEGLRNGFSSGGGGGGGGDGGDDRDEGDDGGEEDGENDGRKEEEEEGGGVWDCRRPRDCKTSEEGGGASLLVVTRPKNEIDYPLWPGAREAWARDQPGAFELEDDLRAAGFRMVTSRIMTYPCAVDLKSWLGMVRNRFWSTFSNFTDEELEAGCATIAEEARVDGDGRVHFEERLVFISARL
jgi:hypothetical protein